jgi:hypothetical protein
MYVKNYFINQELQKQGLPGRFFGAFVLKERQN